MGGDRSAAGRNRKDHGNGKRGTECKKVRAANPGRLATAGCARIRSSRNCRPRVQDCLPPDLALGPGRLFPALSVSWSREIKQPRSICEPPCRFGAAPGNGPQGADECSVIAVIRLSTERNVAGCRDPLRAVGWARKRRSAGPAKGSHSRFRAIANRHNVPLGASVHPGAAGGDDGSPALFGSQVTAAVAYPRVQPQRFERIRESRLDRVLQLHKKQAHLT